MTQLRNRTAARQVFPLPLATLLASLIIALPLFAPGSARATAPVAATDAPMTAAEVRKIDKDTMKITLKHEEIKNLDMPAMTMVFQVKDVSLLDKIKTGDKVKFAAEKSRGGYAVTHIEVSK